MNTPCEAQRVRLMLEGPETQRSAELSAHLVECEACARFAARLERLGVGLRGLARVEPPAELEARVDLCCDPSALGVRAGQHIAGLTHRTAPAELEGRVVAALFPGRREERAVRHLAGLRRLVVPPVLERLVRERVPRRIRRHSAPPELSRKLERDLFDLPAAAVRHQTARLERQRAPEALARLVRTRLSNRLSRRGLHWVAATAGLVLAAAWLFGRGGGPLPAGSGVEPSPDVARSRPAGSERTLPPTVASLVDGVSGGLYTLERVALTDPAGEAAAATDRTAPSPGAAAGRPRPAARVPVRGGAAASGAGSSPAGGGPAPAAPVAGPGTRPAAGLLAALAASPEERAFRGVRRVELAGEGGSGPLVYTEEVASDGRGRFSVDVLQVLEPGALPDPNLFIALSKAREGFTFRYRDFRIRDPQRFADQYETFALGLPAVVAGISCDVLTIRRRGGASRAYRIALDPLSGMVLRWEELDGQGRSVSRVEYESIAFDPDFSHFDLSGGPTGWETVDPSDPQALPFPLLLPEKVPVGYELVEVARATDPLGEEWLRASYTDGLEVLFFLHTAAPDPSAAKLQGQPMLAATFPVDRNGILFSHTVGTWSVVECELDGRRAAVLGKLPLIELELSLQSALQ